MEYTSVLLANILTIMFLWGAVEFSRREKTGDFSWIHWAAMGFPIAILIGGLLSEGATTPHFDALRARDACKAENVKTMSDEELMRCLNRE